MILSFKQSDIPMKVEKIGNVTRVTVSRNDVGDGMEYMDILYNHDIAGEGDEGYAVLPCNAIMYFESNDDSRIEIEYNKLPLFGAKLKGNSFVAIVTSMSYNYRTIFEKKHGRYYLYPRFVFEGLIPDEDIVIEYHELSDEDASYSTMARVFRKYLLDNKICTPLSERMENNETLSYCVKAPLVRIRQGWKPCPATVLEQTEENEPEMHVACDFEQVEKMVDEFKKQGIGMAEFQLVGWNKSGHDGRWPDALPVEPKLGGEAGLRKLIGKVKDNGYYMSCHTNSTDAYSIAKLWNREDVGVHRNGELNKGFRWSGGQMYFLCPEKAWENANKVLREVADLGFRGIHYIDVLSSVFVKSCWHPDHPHTVNEGIEYYRKIGELSKELFGGFSSEGGAGYACPFMDYVLYVGGGIKSCIRHEEVPLWELIYHGILCYNPFSDGMNYTIKDKDIQLKVMEFGGRPSFYFHSRFVDESSGVKNWMGLNDLTTDDESLSECVGKIKEGWDEYEKISHLQTEFMESHERCGNVVTVTYSDGTKMIVDYDKKEYRLEK